MDEKNTEQVRASIRRNTGYAMGRAFSQITTVVTIMVCAGLGGLLGPAVLGKELNVLIFILTGALAGVVPGLLLSHVANAIFDGADSLVQIAKFQDRSLKRRKDAIEIVEKIRAEVEDEETKTEPPPLPETGNEMDSEPTTDEEGSERPASP